MDAVCGRGCAYTFRREVCSRRSMTGERRAASGERERQTCSPLAARRSLGKMKRKIKNYPPLSSFATTGG
jgi:hypothetical protein